MSETPGGKGSLAFFGLWLLLHEKADDWIRDAIRRARETPEDVRDEYERFLLAVDREKELLKGVVGRMAANQIRALGFLGPEEARALRDELRELRERLRALEERLDRMGDGTP